MKFIDFKGGGVVHVVRAIKGTTVTTACGRTTGQFGSVFDRPSVGHLNICARCVRGT